MPFTIHPFEQGDILDHLTLKSKGWIQKKGEKAKVLYTNTAQEKYQHSSNAIVSETFNSYFWVSIISRYWKFCFFFHYDKCRVFNQWSLFCQVFEKASGLGTLSGSWLIRHKLWTCSIRMIYLLSLFLSLFLTPSRSPSLVNFHYLLPFQTLRDIYLPHVLTGNFQSKT